MPSPYPLSYSFKWPFLFHWPSTKNHTKIGKTPTQMKLQHTKSSDSKKLIFMGDIMVMQGDRIPLLDPELTSLVSSADVVIGNCEAPVGKHPRNPKVHYNFSFHMPFDSLQGILDQFGANRPPILLSTANNHSGDRDIGAYLKTIPNLKELGVTPMGQWKQDEEPLTIIDVNNIRLGISSWTHWMNNDVFKKNPGVNRWHDIETTCWQDVKKDNNIDLLIAFPHWEYEFQHFPRYESRSIAKQLMNTMDFDLIVGSHPHTLLPMERINKGLCFYSLGNFCGLGVAWPVKLIPILEVHVSRNTKAEIADYKIHFFYQNHTKDGVEIIPLHAAPTKIRNKLLQRISKIYDKPVFDTAPCCQEIPSSIAN